VDEPCALIGGDEIARQERPRLGEEAAEMVHRMAGKGASKLRAFPGPVDDVVRNAKPLANLLDQLGCDQQMLGAPQPANGFGSTRLR
jgi:hypothetical protein